MLFISTGFKLYLYKNNPTKKNKWQKANVIVDTAV